MSDHPTPEEISAFVRGELDPKRASTFASHIIRGCPTCCAEAAAMMGLGQSAPSPDEHDAAIDRAFQSAQRIVRARDRENQQARRISALIQEKGMDALRTLKKSGPALVEALLERSWALRHENPAQMAELARLATLAARDLDPVALGPERVSDIKCRAHAELGNALRVSELFDEAQSAFHRAYNHYRQGSQNPLLLARLMDVHSSLFRARRRFKVAHNSLLVAYTIYIRNGQRHLAGRAILKMGIFSGYAGEPEKALRLVRKGLKLIDASLDPELAFAGIHNQIWFLADCGHFEQAEKLLFQNRGRYEGQGRLNRLRLRWMEGRIDTGLGRHERAATIFGEVKDGFNEAGLGFPAALASLDQALALMRRGRTSDAREIALEAAEAFRALSVEREMLTATLFLREAFLLGVAQISLLEDVIAFLRRAEHDPEARFDPRPI